MIPPGRRARRPVAPISAWVEADPLKELVRAWFHGKRGARGCPEKSRLRGDAGAYDVPGTDPAGAFLAPPPRGSGEAGSNFIHEPLWGWRDEGPGAGGHG